MTDVKRKINRQKNRRKRRVIVGDAFLSTLKEIAALAARLPAGPEVTVVWPHAPPDLLLVLALQRRGRLRSIRLAGDGKLERAEWKCGSVVVRALALQSAAPSGKRRPDLKLVRP